uniref:Uncharacterized protein n=1 Tax=Onchocerca volvulus TaxID=6282 RepID=A0A8R1Y337_ONCVO
MERWYMEFVDIEGMELFMSGFVVMVYDDRLYMRKDNIQALSAINRVKGIWRALVIENLAHGLECERILKISSVSFGSILPDDFNSIAFECVKKLVKELSCASEQSSSILSAKCDGNKRSTLFNNFPYIAVYFTNDDTSDALSPSLRSFVILTSFAQDSWSATRLLSKVCPIILPALRRSAQESMGYLNIMSVLISYVMTSPVEDNDNTDIELRANFQMLKNFVDTVVVMNEMLQSNIQPNEAVKSALKMAVEFMITIPNYTNPSVMNKMIVDLNRNIEQLSTNFALINSTVMSNKYQTKTSSQTDAHVIAISLCDRLTRLNGIEGIGIVSPLFKSLKSIAVVSNPMIAVNQKVIAEQNRTSNVLEIRIASFMNIDTPVSRHPESLKRKDSYKVLIPISKKKKMCRNLNSFADAKGNQRMNTKKNIKNQTKITDFFKKYS